MDYFTENAKCFFIGAFHYVNTPMHYTALNTSLKILIFRLNFVVLSLIFPQNMHCEYLLEIPDIKAVLSSTKQFLL